MNAKDVIQTLLEQEGLSRYRLAKRLGVNESQLSRAFNNKSDPAFSEVARWLEVMGYRLSIARVESGGGSSAETSAIDRFGQWLSRLDPEDYDYLEVHRMLQHVLPGTPLPTTDATSIATSAGILGALLVAPGTVTASQATATSTTAAQATVAPVTASQATADPETVTATQATANPETPSQATTSPATADPETMAASPATADPATPASPTSQATAASATVSPATASASDAAPAGSAPLEGAAPGSPTAPVSVPGTLYFYPENIADENWRAFYAATVAYLYRSAGMRPPRAVAASMNWASAPFRPIKNLGRSHTPFDPTFLEYRVQLPQGELEWI